MAKHSASSPPITPEVIPETPTELIETKEPEVLFDGTLSAMNRPRFRGDSILTSLKLDTVDGKRLLYNIVSGVSVPLRNSEGKVIHIVGYLAQRGMVQDGEAVEPRLGVKLLLLDADGTRYYSTAQSILSAVDRLIAFFGQGPYDPPIDVTITKGLTANGRPWYTMQLV